MPELNAPAQPSTATRDNLVRVGKPQAGQSSALVLAPGAAIALDFDITEAEAILQNGALIFRFADDSEIQLQNFEAVLASTELILQDGTEISGDQVMGVIQPGGDEPAAGPGSTSGGAGEYDDYLGSITGPIERLGTLDPRQLTDPQTDLEGGAGLVPPDPPETPLVLADDTDLLYYDRILSEQGEFSEVGKILPILKIYNAGPGPDDTLYDSHTRGNVLSNDIGDGLRVTGFTHNGTTYVADGSTVTLSSGARFSLGADGSYRYAYDTTETVDSTQRPNFSTLSFPGLNAGHAPGQDKHAIARIELSDLTDDDWLQFDWSDTAGNKHNAVYPEFAIQNNTVELYDLDGFASLDITVLAGSVTFESLKVEYTDSTLTKETIQYQVTDAYGASGSANLILDFAATNPPPVA